MKTFDIVVAADLNLGIGKAGGIPWNLSGDLRHFKEITTATSVPSKKNAVIMGRKTWESLPQGFRPLPQRVNLVLSKNKKYSLPQGVLRAQGLNAAFNLFENSPLCDSVESIFVIGGGEIFKEALKNPRCSKIYLTQILTQFDCDTFFPPFNSQFKQISVSKPFIENSTEYILTVYQRL